MLASAILTLVACNNTDTLAPDTSTPTAPIDQSSPVEVVSIADPSLASASTGRAGIPIGVFAQPTSLFGSRYNGALRNISPNQLVKELAAIKSRGGRVALMFAGNEHYYKDGKGHFSLDLWKSRINRFKGINFGSYVSDGTIIGHYLLDEPNDKNNWNGTQVSSATIEQMAQYSKAIWPSMATIVRVEPDYLTGNFKALDAAWAQYVNRKGSAKDFIQRNVANAQKHGLQLIVGLNFLKGGPGNSKMTPAQIQDYGSALLANSYPCAFISWTYNSTYLNSSGVSNAMDGLRRLAQNRSAKSCKG